MPAGHEWQAEEVFAEGDGDVEDLPVRARPGFGQLLGRPGAARLLVASLVGRLPTGMIALATLLLVTDRSSAARAATVVAVLSVANAASAPALGRLADRRGQRPVLFATAVAHPTALLLLVLAVDVGSTGLTFLAALVGGATFPPVAACARSSWPRLVPPDLVPLAYSLEAVLTEVVWILGPLVAGVAVALVHPAAGLVAAAVCGGTGTLAVAMMIGHRDAGPLRHPGGLLGPLRVPGVRLIVGVSVLVGVAIGTVITVLGAGPGSDDSVGSGLLFAVWGLGSAVGGLLLAAVPPSSRASRQLAVALAVLAVAHLPLVAATSTIQLGALLVLAGLPLAPSVTLMYRLLAEVTPPAQQTEAFNWLVTANLLGGGLGSLLAGACIAAGELGWSYGAAAGLVGIAALLAFAGRRSLVGGSTAESRELAVAA